MSHKYYITPYILLSQPIVLLLDINTYVESTMIELLSITHHLLSV